MKHVVGDNSRSTLTNVQEEDIQPNACDLRLGKVFHVYPELFEISNDHKKHRTTEEIHPDQDGYYFLDPGHYEIAMENVIEVGEDEAGWVITRSTLIRNGVFITGGLYDSMYTGPMGAMLNVTIGPLRIKRGTRIGQYLSFDAEMLHHYNGSYGVTSTGELRADEKNKIYQ